MLMVAGVPIPLALVRPAVGCRALRRWLATLEGTGTVKGPINVPQFSVVAPGTAPTPPSTETAAVVTIR